MTSLPVLLAPDQLADLCRETGTGEHVQPDLVEKDFYLTRLLWTLGRYFGDRLLLKGGTLLSKVDLGFLRMSEDADLVLSGEPSQQRGGNVQRINEVRDGLKQVLPGVGLRARFPGGQISERGRHAVWELEYPSDFGPQQIRLEVSIRRVLRKPRQVTLKQLLAEPLVGDYAGAQCWALDGDEARAEKVRAAFTRDAVRDFYDLDCLAERGVDISSPDFLGLVDAKLAELDHAPLATHSAVFGLTPERMKSLRGQVKSELRPVLRLDARPFDIDAMTRRFAAAWGLPAPSSG